MSNEQPAPDTQSPNSPPTSEQAKAPDKPKLTFDNLRKKLDAGLGDKEKSKFAPIPSLSYEDQIPDTGGSISPDQNSSGSATRAALSDGSIKRRGSQEVGRPIHLRLPLPLDKTLRVHAALTGQRPTNVIEAAIEEYIKVHGIKT